MTRRGEVRAWWLAGVVLCGLLGQRARADETKPAAAPAAGEAPAPAAPAAEASKPAPKWYDQLTFNAFAQAGYLYNLNNPSTRQNGLRVFDSDANSFTVGTIELVVQKPVAAPGDIGFRADFDLGGVISPRTTSLGDTPGNFGLRQGFVSWIAPVGSGLRIDIGKFVTLHGFEYIEGVDNPNDNTSRSLLFNYAIPFTHTGVQFTYTFSPLLKAVLQVVNGWDQAIAQQKGKAVCGQLALTPNEAISLYANYCGGVEATGATTTATRHIVDLNGTFKVTPWLTLGINGDYGLETGSSKVTAGDNASWFGGALYAKAESASGWGLALRGEYFKDEGGTRTPYGVALSDFEVTVTPYVKINSRLTVRAEFRFDSADTPVFDLSDGSKGKTQATLGLAALVSF